MEAVSTERSWRSTQGAALVVATAAVVLALGLLAGQDGPRVALVSALVTMAVGAAAAMLDGLLGMFVGLFGSVLVVAAHRAWGGWDVGDVAQAVLVIGLGWAAGMTGSYARRTARHLATPPHGAVTPSLHTLGLLDAASARLRIDEELHRRAGTDRALTVVLIRLDVLGDLAVDEPVHRSVTKAVARAVESSTRETDVPFALTEEILGVVLPDTGEGHAWRVLGRLVQDTLATSFAHRADGGRVRLRDAVALHTVLVTADESTRTADHLLGPGRTRVESLSEPDPS